MADEPDSGVSSALRSVTRGMGAQFVGMGASRGFAFATNLLLTNSLGTALFGVYSFANTLISIASTLVNLGTDQSIIRFVPQYDDRPPQNRVIGLATLTSSVAGVVVGVALYFLAPVVTQYTLSNQPLLTDVLRVFAIALPFRTLTGCVASVFRSMEWPGYQVVTSTIGYQAFRLVTVAIAVVIGAQLVGTVAAIVAAAILAFLLAVGLFVSRTDFKPGVEGEEPGLFDFYNFSVPLTLHDIGALFQNKPDILMVGLFLSSSAVGIYNIASVFSQFLRLPLIGFNTMFPPIASRMYGNDELGDLDALFTQVTRWSFTLSLLPSVGLLVYPVEVMSIFGPDFARGAEVVSLFAIAQLTCAAVGPSGYVLMMSNHQYLSMINEWGFGILNVVANYVLITQVGLIGAALATAGSLAFINVLRVIEVWYLEGLFPYSRKYYKPIVAGLVAGAAMIGWEAFAPLSGFVFLVVGGIVGTIAFCLTLFVTGIEPEDREFFMDMHSQYT